MAEGCGRRDAVQHMQRLFQLCIHTSGHSCCTLAGVRRPQRPSIPRLSSLSVSLTRACGLEVGLEPTIKRYGRRTYMVLSFAKLGLINFDNYALSSNTKLVEVCDNIKRCSLCEKLIPVIDRFFRNLQLVLRV